jgi:signal transduction histidine kinase
VKLESAILSGFRAGIIALRTDGTIDYVNPIGSRILECDPIAIGENIHDKSSANAFYRLLSDSLSMNFLPTRIETELPGKDGDRQVLGFTLAELKDEKGKLGICAFFKDLTHVEMAQENENLKGRLQVLGQMAASLAHEIRNPIASIGVHCGVLKPHLAGNEKLSASLRSISAEVARVEEIISECLTFVRPDVLDFKQAAIDALIADVRDKYQGLFPDMAFSFSTVLPCPVMADVDPGLFSRAISNLVANAAEACQGKGHVDICLSPTRHFTDITHIEKSGSQLMPSEVELTEKDYLRIRIKDDGPGIAPEVQERIFIPFYTTKKRGTGIGLPMTQKVIHSHSGVIDLKSAPGAGTEFVIQIPVRQRHV